MAGGAEHLEQVVHEAGTVSFQVGEVTGVDGDRDSWVQQHWDDGLFLQAASRRHQQHGNAHHPSVW